jgi:hypothetical protein
VVGQLDLSLESTENQMMWLGEQLLSYGKIILASEIRQRLGEVTAAQIRAVARDFFRPERLNLALVSPLKKGHKLLNYFTGKPQPYDACLSECFFRRKRGARAKLSLRIFELCACLCESAVPQLHPNPAR